MSTNTNKNKSSPWILSWLSQLTNKSPSETNKLLWNKDNNNSSITSPIVITEPATHNKKIQFEPRPSITISLSSSQDRRNSQQTTSSSFTSDTASYRRDSSERSILSDLWLKAKRKNYSNLNKLHKQDLSCPSSLRQQHIDHLKRHSISSSPTASRPNSILVSQPNSPSFPHLYLNNYQDFVLDDDIDTYWLNNDYDDIYNPVHHTCFKKDRWVIKHELIKLAVDGLFAFDELVTLSSSIEKYVLQIGCGDGLWGIDVAIQNPRWMVIGIDDMDNKQPTRNIPRNFKFIKCQSMIQALSSFSDASFDFITSRFLILENTRQQYKEIVNECLRLCKSGGNIEVLELDMRIYQQKIISITTTHLLNNEVMLVLENKSLDPRLARRLKDLVETETFDVSCKAKYISLPLGVWGGRLGVMFRDDVHQLFESFQASIANAKQTECRTEEAMEYKIEQLDSELEANRAFMNLHVLFVHKY